MSDERESSRMMYRDSTRPFDTHEKIERPEYCICELPWQTSVGPLKDGSHYSSCLAAEVAEDMAALKAERDALRSVVREFTDWIVTDTLVELGSHWTTEQKAAIRSALDSATD